MMEGKLRIEGPHFQMGIDDEPLRLAGGSCCGLRQKLPAIHAGSRRTAKPRGSKSRSFSRCLPTG